MNISNTLNTGALPPGYFALAEQIVSGPIPDVVTLQRRSTKSAPARGAGGVAVADAPPRARFVTSAQVDPYVQKANRIAIRHRHGRIVAVIEIVSPGNKASQHALRSFVEKAAEFLRQGINLLIVDLFPPSPRDPRGIHNAIWDEICAEPIELPADKPLTAAAYSAGEVKTAYVEPLALGDSLPSLPIFLEPDVYIPAPLEETYRTTWETCPDALREAVEGRE